MIEVHLQRFPLKQTTTQRVPEDIDPGTIKRLENPFGRLRFALCVVGVDGGDHNVELSKTIVGEIERSVGVRAAPQDVADALVAAGASLFTIGVGGPDYDLGLVKEWIVWRDAQQ